MFALGCFCPNPKRAIDEPASRTPTNMISLPPRIFPSSPRPLVESNLAPKQEGRNTKSTRGTRRAAFSLLVPLVPLVLLVFRPLTQPVTIHCAPGRGESLSLRERVARSAG